MPELPEVETTKCGIEPFVCDQTVTAVEIRQPKLRYPIPLELAQKLPGEKILSVTRRAKYLLFETAIGHLVIHLGMSGHLRLVDIGTPPERHSHADFVFSNNKILRFNDPRRFGVIDWTEQPIAVHALIAHLGVEPLSEAFNGQLLHKKWARKSQAVKTALMDSKTVVGIGNIYAAEALFLTRIHPARQASSLSEIECEALAQASKQVLADAIRAGGTTLNDFYGSNGKPGYFQQQLNVYGRTGEPCTSCQCPIEKITQTQRSSFFCPQCQT